MRKVGKKTDVWDYYESQHNTVYLFAPTNVQWSEEGRAEKGKKKCTDDVQSTKVEVSVQVQGRSGQAPPQ